MFKGSRDGFSCLGREYKNNVFVVYDSHKGNVVTLVAIAACTFRVALMGNCLWEEYVINSACGVDRVTS